MPETQHCGRCGALLALSAAGGLCPSCMLQEGLQLPLPPGPGLNAAEAPETEMPQVVGGFKVLQELGRGGMGVVYVAEQKEPVRRRVALKIVKLGMDTEQVIARFEAERQALALMDHPNIARIFQAGATDTGRPYFAMELVSGAKITDYCDQHKLSTSERLNLFIQVCRAVQHAHQKGIIHRDLKPSNILIAEQDGVPVPKVIDFGVAKATGPALSDKTVFTTFAQMIGTPAYMSPEQAEMGGTDIDTRSDIYSLGVLLYELLTGRTPFDSKELLRAGLDAMRRKIREEEPLRPSTRLTSLTNEELTTIARQRKAEPPKLVNLVRGDLDWIAMKALEKERASRYETASGLAMDVQRYLSNEPVLARPASNLYRLRKSIRRHTVGVAAILALAAALISGVVLSTWQAARARRAEKDAKANEQRAEQITKFLTGMFETIDPAAAKLREITVREVLDDAARTVGTAFSNQPLSELTMRNTLADIYGKLGRDDQALPHAEAAVHLAKLASGDKNSRELAGALNNLAACLEAVGRSAEALPKYEEALAMYQRLAYGDNADVAISLNRVALCMDGLGRSVEALPKYQAALAMSRRIHQGDHADVAETMNNLASCLMNLGKSEEALTNYQAAFLMRQRLYPGDHPDVVTSLNNLATCLDALGREADALTNYEAALSMSQHIYRGDHPYVAISLNNVAACLLDLGRMEEALPKYQATLAMRQRIYQGDHPYVATGLNNLAYCLLAMGRASEALPYCEAASAMYQRVYQADHPNVASALDSLASCLEALRCPREALPKFQQALAMRQRLFPGDHPYVATSLLNMASCLTTIGRTVEAWPSFEAASSMSDRLDSADSSRKALIWSSAAGCLEDMGRSAEALEKYRSATDMFTRLSLKQPSNDTLKVALAKCQYKAAETLGKAGNKDESQRLFRKALEVMDGVVTDGSTNAPLKQLRLAIRAKLQLDEVEVAIVGIASQRQAARLGLQSGDVLLRYAGEPITSSEQFSRLVARKIPPNELEIRRDSTPMKVTVSETDLGAQCREEIAKAKGQ